MPPRKAKAGPSRVTPPLPTAYPGKKDGKGMEEAEWEACRIMLDGVYNAKDGSRFMSEIFRILPDRDEYADYYESIPEPEALDLIAISLGEPGIFASPEEFFKQLHLVFLNAKHYNEEGSQVYEDAKALEDRIHEAWRANTTTGAFSNPDPYHLTPVKRRGRPRKTDRAVSSTSRTSATPAPTDTVAPAAAQSLVVTLPTLVESPARPTAAPITKPEPVPIPVPSPAIPISNPPPNLAVAPPLPPFVPTQSPMTMPPGHNDQSSSSALIAPPSPTSSERLRRKAQADADARVIAHLDAKLPRWEGPQLVIRGAASSGGIAGSGWFGQGVAPGYQHSGPNSQPHSARIQTVLHAIAEYRDNLGIQLSGVFGLLPPSFDMPYLSFHAPITFESIRNTTFSSLPEFDMQMVRLFEKCRRYFPEGSVEYGRVLVLQRLYNALTSPYPMAVHPGGVVPPNNGNFASLPAGPGNARSLHETNQDLKAGVNAREVGYGVTTFRVGTKDRIFTEEARLKGVAYKTGDFVHLINPDDATKPIVGQIFKTFVPTKGFLTHHVTVCWYFRPEQMVHPARRTFFDREVFKTSHFCDHPVEDIIERISCQFYVKYVRGRPQAPEYYPGWPIYICHSRYNDRAWATVRIKNWASCIPDELRQTDFMNIIPFDRQIEPQVVKSPFLRGIKGPGFFAEARQEFAEDYEDEEEYEKVKKPIGTGRKGRPAGPVPIPSPSTFPAMASPSPGLIPSPGQAPHYPTVPGPQAPGPVYPIASPASLPHSQPPMTARPTYTPTPSNPAYRATPPHPGQGYTPRSGPPVTPGSAAGPSTASPHPHPHAAHPSASASISSRSITAAMGGAGMSDQIAVKEYLPLDIVRLFERDSRNQVLWFSGPPLPPGTIHIPTQPSHSIEYLEYLTKRKRGISDANAGSEGRSAKRYTMKFRDRDETDSGLLGTKDEGEGEEEGQRKEKVEGEGLDVWWAQGQSGEELHAGLKALLESV